MLQQTLELQVRLRSALWPLAEFARIAGCLDEAERLATVLDDRGQLARTTATMSVLRWITGDAAAARRFADDAREMAVALDDRPLRAMANDYRGLACYLLAEYRDAEAAYGENVGMLADAGEQDRLGASSTLVVSAAWLVLPLAERGAFADGLEHGRAALRLAEAGQDPYGIVTAAYCLAYLHGLKGELDAARPLLERALAISREREFAVWLPQVTGVLGHVYAQQGRLAEGLALLDEAIAVYDATRAWPFRPLLARAGDRATARGHLTAAATLYRELQMDAARAEAEAALT